MNGFARRKEQSKEDIRKAARELFSQFGVERVSVADIAQKAGVAPATIYNNFGSKDALAREFVTTAVDQLAASVQDILATERPYQEKVQAFVQFISDSMAQARSAQPGGPVFAGSADLMNDPEIKAMRDAAQEKLAGLLLGLVKEGRRQGQVHGKLSDEAYRIYFKLFMNMFTSLELQQHFHHNPKLAQDLSTLMLHGLSGQQSSTL
jgi:AcrR family transcriptional regulator